MNKHMIKYINNKLNNNKINDNKLNNYTKISKKDIIYAKKMIAFEDKFFETFKNLNSYM